MPVDRLQAPTNCALRNCCNIISIDDMLLISFIHHLAVLLLFRLDS